MTLDDRVNPLHDAIALVVEDEWLVRMELVQALEDEGCHVVQSGSAEEALDLLEGDGSFDLLVTDVRLSGTMDGWALAVVARSLRPSLATIYLSANPPAPERQVTGGRFVDKPALMDEVIAIARELLASPHE